MAQTTSTQIAAIGTRAIASSDGPDCLSSDGAGFGDGWASPL